MTEEMTRWDLSVLYKGIDDPARAETAEKLKAISAEAEALTGRLNAGEGGKALAEAIALMEKAEVLISREAQFLSLSRSADTKNTYYPAALNQLFMSLTPVQVLDVAMLEALAKLEDLDGFIAEYGLEHYRYYLEEGRKKAAHRLDQKLEALAARLNVSGGGAWSNMASYLTSTLEIEWEGKTLTLPDIRNLAYDADPGVRRRAYEAELAAYPAIESAMAFAIHSIKSRVNLMARERGYASALDEALDASRLSRQSLDAMLGVMEESLPMFRRYFRAKAKLLGAGEKLPFYDLFAPVGKPEGSYTIEEAQQVLLETFGALSPEIAALMKRAFDERWIDYLPRPGKVGGAFCSNIPEAGQSRVLTNFDGSFSSISTLAHELGHAYHGFCIESHRPLNRDYSMPVAETASTFNETHLTLWALENAPDDASKLAILEQFVSGTAQTIVDILSRFLFEKEVFERCEKEFLDAAALKDIMFRAQQSTYGDAMPDEFRHPYMWVCKSHYYSTGLSFYNFPYAFGQLFSMGLYSMYQKEGPAFMDRYKALLHKTTVASCEAVAAEAGVDITKPDFWREGMAAFGEMIDRYCELAEKA